MRNHITVSSFAQVATELNNLGITDQSLRRVETEYRKSYSTQYSDKVLWSDIESLTGWSTHSIEVIPRDNGCNWVLITNENESTIIHLYYFTP